jgi:hypothetical protein
MAVDPDHLYWTFLGVVGRSDHDGQNVQRVFFQIGNDDVKGVAVDSAHVY